MSEFFVSESRGNLGILRLEPHPGAALSNVTYAQGVSNAIEAFESAGKSALLVIVPPGNFAPNRLEPFWENAKLEGPDERALRVRYSRPTSLPRDVLRFENGVVQLLKLLHKVNLFKMIAVEGPVDFDMLGLLLAFDIRLCDESCLFENRMVDRSLPPGFGVVWNLMRHVGQAAAADILLNQRSIDLAQALELKLVTHAFPGQIADQAITYAAKVAENPPSLLHNLVTSFNALHGDFAEFLDECGGGFTEVPAE